MTWQVASSEAVIQGRKSDESGSYGVFYNLILEKMYYHFCYILFVDVGMTYIAVWLSVGYLGAILEVGHHTFYNFNYFGWEPGKIYHDLTLLVLFACFFYDNI